MKMHLSQFGCNYFVCEQIYMYGKMKYSQLSYL